VTASTPDELDAVLTEAVGRPLDELDAATAIDVADRLRAVVAALPPSTPADTHYAGRLTAAAERIERRAGVT
jgi:hypothetical protein